MSLAQGVHALNGIVVAGTTATTSAISTASSGSGIWVFINYDKTVQSFVSVTDSKSNTWVQIGTETLDTTSTFAARRYYCANATGGSGHTFTLTCTGSSVCGIAAIEITTTNGSGISLDQQSAGTDDATAFDSPSVTTTSNNQIMLSGFTCIGGSGTYTHTPGNSFTLTDETTSDQTFPMATALRAYPVSIGTYNATWTTAGAATNTVVSIDTFSEAAGGGGLTTEYVAPVVGQSYSPMIGRRYV